MGNAMSDPKHAYSNDSVPKCASWILGKIEVQEGSELVTYERAILVSFKTVEEYRAACAFMNPILEGDQ